MTLSTEQVEILYIALGDALRKSENLVRTNKLTKGELDLEASLQKTCQEIRKFILPLAIKGIIIEELPF